MESDDKSAAGVLGPPLVDAAPVLLDGILVMVSVDMHGMRFVFPDDKNYGPPNGPSRRPGEVQRSRNLRWGRFASSVQILRREESSLAGLPVGSDSPGESRGHPSFFSPPVADV